jgi:hypothetical protein
LGSLHLVRHVLHEETGPESYAQLWGSLVVSHALSNYQKMEQMIRLPPLSNCKPSVMLAEMLEYSLVGESAMSPPCSHISILQHLPCEIHVLLSKDDLADMRAIAKTANRLIAKVVPQTHDSCVTVTMNEMQEEPSDKAAAQGARRQWVTNSKWPQQAQRRARAVASTSTNEARTRLILCGRLCASTMIHSVSRPATASRAAFGWKTRPPGCYFGGVSWSTVLCCGKLFKPPFSG